MTTTTREFTRTFAAELEVRSAGNGGDGRTIEGIAVPYGVRSRITADLTEVFARGAFNHQLAAVNRVKLRRQHAELIGVALELRDDAAGLWGRWSVAETEEGDKTLALVRNGALTDLSIGFRERQNRRLQDGTIMRTSADLREVSVVDAGAYGEHAAISAVRSAADAEAAHAPNLAAALRHLQHLNRPLPLQV